MADNSFIYLNRITTEKSRLFENLVFNYLQRKYTEVYYYKTTNNKEVDFFINVDNNKLLIQASVSLENFDTKQREIKALTKAMNEQKIKTAYIYTLNETEEIQIDLKTIVIIPFWKVCINR